MKVVDDKIEDVEFSIFEPPRFFEAFLRGRPLAEAPDITARICGICPVAYQMSSVHAMEDALGVTVDGSLRDLRRLLYCGEWIESHALHIYLLHAPDFLGYESGIHMAADHREVVEQGLRLKKAGNSIVGLVRWARDPPDQRSGRRVLSRTHETRTPSARLGTGLGEGRSGRHDPIRGWLHVPRGRHGLRVRIAEPPR